MGRRGRPKANAADADEASKEVVEKTKKSSGKSVDKKQSAKKASEKSVDKAKSPRKASGKSVDKKQSTKKASATSVDIAMKATPAKKVSKSSNKPSKKSEPARDPVFERYQEEERQMRIEQERKRQLAREHAAIEEAEKSKKGGKHFNSPTGQFFSDQGTRNFAASYCNF